ncbi:hypothetical protein [Aquimarina agarilytica]|uniref:hypothetical protein n=1 Tax=Aquimarina agarilytica TaxID=1087449 RepID=UPI0002895ABE|nr:hypothetical protein [Aquimarina agarilytica]
MKSEHHLLLKVMKNFEGMNKIDVFDMLQKIEVLLFYASSPITKYSIKSIIEADLDQKKDVDPFHFTILPNGNFCEFKGSNAWLHLYQEKRRGIFRFSLFNRYYFKTKYAPLELLILNKRNLLENIENTPLESKVKIFLKKHRPAEKDAITDRFLILDLT